MLKIVLVWKTRVQHYASSSCQKMCKSYFHSVTARFHVAIVPELTSHGLTYQSRTAELRWCVAALYVINICFNAAKN